MPTKAKIKSEFPRLKEEESKRVLSSLNEKAILAIDKSEKIGKRLFRFGYVLSYISQYLCSSILDPRCSK